MPKITADLNSVKTPQGYTFSGVKAEDLKATEYTLVTVVQDKSGSVLGFDIPMQDCHKTILKACQKSPRKDNLMLREVLFNNDVEEYFGFRMLSDIKESEFDTMLRDCRGSTALFDATHTSIDATLSYGKELTKKGIMCNAIIFVITDGDDNASKYTPNKISKLVADAKKDESVESVLVILVGVNTKAGGCQGFLDTFKNDAGLDQYIDIDDATPQKLAKLADFVSRSISSQSQSLNSGGPSQILTF
jgi:hypothetical protein